MRDVCYSKSDMPLFSVVIPVYNAEAFLEECLQSVADQECGYFETIVVDDGSTDRSFAICDHFFRENALTGRLISQKNSGPLLARQAGYSAAKGEYIVHVDSDDELRKDALAQIAKAIQVTKADIILFDYANEKPFSNVWKSKRGSLAAYDTKVYSRDELLLCYIRGEGIYLWEKAIKRSLLFPALDESFAGLRYAEDRLQTCVLYDRAQSLAYIPYELYYHRVLSTGLDGVFDSRRFRDYCVVQSTVNDYVHRWNEEYSGLGIESDYMTSTMRWIIRRAVASAHDKELIKEIARSEELSFVSSNEDSVGQLSFAERILLIALKRDHRFVLLIARALKNAREMCRRKR